MKYFLLVCFSLTVAILVTSAAACPKFVTRKQWGARRPKKTSPLKVNPPSHVVIHHTDSGSCKTRDACIKLVKSFQNHHMNTNGWDDIGYNFLVGEDGNTYEGRGWEKTGAHAPKYNSKSIGIAVIGKYTSKLPNAAALKAAKNLIACGVSKGKIKKAYRLIGHRQATNTQCPGNKLFEEIKKWPKWTPKP